MKLSVKFHQEEFSDELSGKEAYLKACRWVAENVIRNEVEIGETFWKIEKVKEASLPTFRLELYATLESGECTKSFCDRCKEYHSSFYLNQQYNCDACNFTAFKLQMEQKLRIKKAYRKERLGRLVGEDT
ncbi:MAG: hypothetical protein N3B21_19400 [Clostridia bacterium]|nr:hypothetical protein [Clostridia bacterium]